MQKTHTTISNHGFAYIQPVKFATCQRGVFIYVFFFHELKKMLKIAMEMKETRGFTFKKNFAGGFANRERKKPIHKFHIQH